MCVPIMHIYIEAQIFCHCADYTQGFTFDETVRFGNDTCTDLRADTLNVTGAVFSVINFGRFATGVAISGSFFGSELIL